MKKEKKLKRFLRCTTLFFILICLSACSKKNSKKDLEVYRASASYAVDMDNPMELIGLSDNVFVGHIEELAETYYVSNFPYTRYNVTVINNIKGNLPISEEVQVNKQGGISEDASYYLLLDNDVLPDEDKDYIFIVNKKSSDGTYTASGINTIVPLYDDDTSNQQTIMNTKDQKDIIKNSKTEDDIINELMKSDNYNIYVNAYENEIPYDPNRH